MEPIWFTIEHLGPDLVPIRTDRVLASDVAARIQDAAPGTWRRVGRREWLGRDDLDERDRSDGAESQVATPPKDYPVTDFLREFGLVDKVVSLSPRSPAA